MATYDLTSSIPAANTLAAGDILNCPYSGAYKKVTLVPGKYKLQVWGAQGGTYSAATGGCGGYSVGTIELTEDTDVYLYAGGAGTSSTTSGSFTTGGFNGGGNAGYRYGGSGGGGSDIRIKSTSLYARVIVAGGGGGGWGYSDYVGGVGGGTSGGQGTGYSTSYLAGAGTATSGGSGKGYSSNYYGSDGSFGTGGNGATNSSSYNRSSGGGGGWYGGGGSGYRSSSRYYYRGGGGAGGGSGYVYSSSTASNYPSGCTLNSSYYLSDASTYTGSSTFISPSGTNETGHTSNGYVRITIIEIKQSTKIILGSEQIKYLQLGNLGVLKAYLGTNLVFNGGIMPSLRNLTIKYSATSTSYLPSVYVNNSQVLTLTESDKEYTIQVNSGSTVLISSSSNAATNFTTAVNSNDKNTYPYWSPSNLSWSRGTGSTTSDYYFTMPNEDVYIYGYVTASSCFVAGTQVFMADNNYKNIEDVHIGDVVYCYDEENNKVDSATVERILISEQSLLMNIKLENDEYFICTGTHPIYSETHRKYVNANELKIGDVLKTNNGSIKISSISIFEDKNTVYNMTVSNYHNYFITGSNILVHNKYS